MLIESVVSSPIVTLPPIVISPVTSKFPVMFTLSIKLIWLLNESISKSPDVVVISLPDNFTFPVSIASPEIIVTLGPEVNVNAWSTSMLSDADVKLTCPVSWFTWN